jgi:hypothetical protein
MGMSPSATVSQLSLSLLACSLALYRFHVEKLSSARASFTSLATIHEMGAIRLYHGQFVSFEWQS